MRSHYSNVHNASVFTDAIMKRPLQGETTTDRLRQLGILSIISTMEQDGDAVTRNALHDYIGQPGSPVSDALTSLIERGLIVERAAPRGEADPQISFAPRLRASMTNTVPAATIQ